MRIEPRHLLGGAGAVLAGAAILAATAGTGSPQAQALTNCATDTAAFNAAEQSVFEQLNAYRQANGLGPVKVSPSLSRAAAFMSEDMLAKGYFNHFEPSGRSPFQRAVDCGYPSQNVGENLAIAYSGSTAMSLWKSSPGHNANMLTSRWVVVGIGQAGGYWAMVFGAIDDSGAPGLTPPAPWTPLPSPTATPSPSPTPGPGSPSLFPIRRATLQMIAAE